MHIAEQHDVTVLNGALSIDDNTRRFFPQASPLTRTYEPFNPDKTDA
jgi:hypothetical protein